MLPWGLTVRAARPRPRAMIRLEGSSPGKTVHVEPWKEE